MGNQSKSSSKKGLKELKITKKSTKSTNSSSVSTVTETSKEKKRLSSNSLLNKTLTSDKTLPNGSQDLQVEGNKETPGLITPTTTRLKHQSLNESDSISDTTDTTGTDIDVTSMMRRVSNSIHNHHHHSNHLHSNSASPSKPVTINGHSVSASPENLNRKKRKSHMSVFSASSIETTSRNMLEIVRDPESDCATNSEGKIKVDEPLEMDNTNDDSDDNLGWEEMEPVASQTIYDENGMLQVHNQSNIGNKPNLDFIDSKSTKKNGKQKLFGISNNDSNDDGFELEEDIRKLQLNPSQNNFGYTKLDDESQALRSRETNKKIDFLFASTAKVSRSRSKLDLSLNNEGEDLVPDNKQMDTDNDILTDDEETMEGLTQEELTAEHQLSSMKKLLTDKEKFAYVATIYVLITQHCADLAELCLSSNMMKKKTLAKQLQEIQKKTGYWQIEIMSRLYHHLEISDEEVEMITKLSSHGLDTDDLCKCIRVARSVDNPYSAESTDDLGNDNDEQKETINNKENCIKNVEETNRESPEEQLGENAELHHDESKTHTPNKVVSIDTIKKDKKLDIDVSWTIICDLFLLLLSKSNYDSRSRTLLIKFAERLNITKDEINHFEKRVIDALELEQSTDEQVWNETDHMEVRRKKVKRKKMLYVGLATIGGSLVLGVSGGLLAPVIGAGVAAGMSTVGITGVTGFLTSAGGTAAVATTSTAIGARIGNNSMTKRMGSVRTFEFKPLHNNRRINLIISVSGWMVGNDDDVRLPFSTVDPIEGDLYSLYWEPEMLKSTGQTINILASEIITQTIQQILGATILTAFMAAIQLPMALSKLGYIIDNPWNVSLDRAWNAGLILADTLASKNLGERPITLIGFSLGSRVIYSCLKELSKRGIVGVVENVIMFGSPVVYHRDELVMCRSVVSGRFVNAYSSKDWILGYLFRATSGGLSTVAGLSPIETVDSIENFDCSEWVQGHMEYRKNIPKLLKKLGFSVLSEEFVEIDDSPDPEQLKKQREVIHTLDEAEKKLNSKKTSHKNSWLPKWLKPKKENWQEMMGTKTLNADKDSETAENQDESIVDTVALQQELEHLKQTVANTPQIKPTEEIYSMNKGTLEQEQDLQDEIKADSQIKSINSKPNFQLLNAGQIVQSVSKADTEAEFQEAETKEFQFGDVF